jgi:hypothetical protein
MSLLELTLAVALLSSPPDALELADTTALHPMLAPALKAVAMEWELLDPREVEYLKNPQDFASDLKLLQGRFEEFHRAPKAAEVNRFPGRDLVGDMLAFNRGYRDSVNSRLDLDMVHADELRTILSETDLLYRVYDAVRDARCEYFYVTYRRQALAQLRDLIGEEAFYGGQLPPHVPLWRIPEAR